MKPIIQIDKHNMVKNPNSPTGRKRTSWLFYKRRQGFELGITENVSS